MTITLETLPIKAKSHDFFSPIDLQGVDIACGSNSRQPSIWFLKNKKLIREWVYANYTDRNEDYDRLMVVKLQG